MINVLQFWVLVAGLIAFVAKFFYPDFPLDEQQILAAVLFLLGLIGVTPQARLAMRSSALGLGDLLKSLAFWTMVVGLAEFVIHYYLPDFPLDQANLLAIVIFVLQQFGINPELRARGLK